MGKNGMDIYFDEYRISITPIVLDFVDVLSSCPYLNFHCRFYVAKGDSEPNQSKRSAKT